MRRNVQTLFALILAITVLAVGVGYRAEKNEIPQSRQGVLDLRTHDFQNAPTLALNGEWAFFWQRLLDPEAFQGEKPPLADAMLPQPGSWDGVTLNGQTLEGKGYGTLHLRLLLPPSSAPLSIRLSSFYPANRIWVNGQLASENGRIALNMADEVMERSVRIVNLPVDAAQVELVIQVSNFHFQKVSPASIQIGLSEELNTRHKQVLALAMFSVGTLLLMGFYHFALYLFRRQSPAPLYLALYCILWSAYIVCIDSSDWAIRTFLPQISGELTYRTWQLCLFLVTPIAYFFYRSLYPQEFPRWIGNALLVVSSVYAVLALCAPTTLLSLALPGFYAVSLARMSFTAWALYRAAQRGREGAQIILNGFILMLLLSINDMFNAMDIIDTVYVLHLGMIVYMFTQALALALRFSKLFGSVEHLSSELIRQNTSLENEISERNRLQREVITVSEEERRRMSHQLHDGLCQQLTGARLQCAGLARMFPENEPGAQTLKKLSDLLDASASEAYELSHGLWPIEHENEDAADALSALVIRMQPASGPRIEFIHAGHCKACVTPHTSQIYSITREAVTNALKHGAPEKIEVRLDCSHETGVVLSISDDGKGWCSAKTNHNAQGNGGLGLRIMAYRARMAGGDFSINERTGRGTCVSCTIPCKALLTGTQ